MHLYKKNLVPEFTSLNSIYRQTQRHSQIISLSKSLMNHFLNSAAIKCILSVLNMYKEQLNILKYSDHFDSQL